MYLEVADIFWASIALLISTTFVITTMIENAKLTASRDEWRKAYYDLKAQW
jgi:hypothetical protein